MTLAESMRIELAQQLLPRTHAVVPRIRQEAGGLPTEATYPSNATPTLFSLRHLTRQRRTVESQ